MRSSVDFPEPFVPSRATISPRPTSRSTPNSTWMPSYATSRQRHGEQGTRRGRGLPGAPRRPATWQEPTAIRDEAPAGGRCHVAPRPAKPDVRGGRRTPRRARRGRGGARGASPTRSRGSATRRGATTSRRGRERLRTGRPGWIPGHRSRPLRTRPGSHRRCTSRAGARSGGARRALQRTTRTSRNAPSVVRRVFTPVGAAGLLVLLNRDENTAGATAPDPVDGDDRAQAAMRHKK